MKILTIVAHPDLANSKVNSAWKAEQEKHSNITVHDLYAKYPNFKIDVKAEQDLLVAHDRIVLQFPMYWYSTPALLKQWQDDVLEYGFAYGHAGKALHGKELMLALSTGGPAEAYQAGGYNYYAVSELTKPLQAMTNLCGMKFLPSFLFQGVLNVTAEQIQENAKELIERIKKIDETIEI